MFDQLGVGGTISDSETGMDKSGAEIGCRSGGRKQPFNLMLVMTLSFYWDQKWTFDPLFICITVKQFWVVWVQSEETECVSRV